MFSGQHAGLEVGLARMTWTAGQAQPWSSMLSSMTDTCRWNADAILFSWQIFSNLVLFCQTYVANQSFSMNEKKFVENESNQGLESVRVFCFVLSGHFVGLALVHFLFNFISVVCFVSEYIELIYDCYVMQITVQNGCVAQFFILAKVLLFVCDNFPSRLYFLLSACNCTVTHIFRK